MDLREQIARTLAFRLEGHDDQYFDWLDEADAVLQVLRQQKPVAWMSPGRERLEWARSDTVFGSHTIPLYAAPGAQAAVPDGWRLVPIDPAPAMLDAAEKLDWSNEDVRGNCCNQWYVMLAAAPKPEGK